MDAYDLGIKQRPCPAAAVNTTDWFFALAYNRPHASQNPMQASDYFGGRFDLNNTNYQLTLSVLTSAPLLFGEYGFDVTKCNVYGRYLYGDFNMFAYTGSIQVSSWIRFPSSLNTQTAIFAFLTGGQPCPTFYLKNKGSGLASCIASQTYDYQTPTYTTESATFSCPTDGSWFYFTLIINCASGSVSIYIGSSLVATISTRSTLFDKSNYVAFNGNKVDCIMRKWTAGNTIIVPTRRLQLA